MYEHTGGMPTTSATLQTHPINNDKDVSDDARDSVEFSPGRLSPSEERTSGQKQTQGNACILGEKFQLIDGTIVIKTVTCATGCKEIKRIFYPSERDLPLVFVANCTETRLDKTG